MAAPHDARADAVSPKKRRHFIDRLPMPAEGAKPRLIWKRAWFLLFALIALILALPAGAFLWNILRPDTAVPARVTLAHVYAGVTFPEQPLR